MTVRSFDFLDLPFLTRYRQDVLTLDSARFLTRGNPLGAGALFPYLNPHRNIYTAVSSENGDSLMGQVILNEGETSARLTFIAPLEKANGLVLPLLDHLTKQAGDWGAFHILAEVDEELPVLRSLRAAGFAIYAWQRVWKLPEFNDTTGKVLWRAAEETDWPAIQSLHGQIVPAMLHPVESLPKMMEGLVCRPEGNLQAYVSVGSGPEGIWIQPLVPPDSACVPGQLAGLVSAIPGRRRLSVFVCVRSYQAWLESALEELGAEAGPRQAVMVKRLATAIKEAHAIPTLEKVLAKAKPAAPISRIEGEK